MNASSALRYKQSLEKKPKRKYVKKVKVTEPKEEPSEEPVKEKPKRVMSEEHKEKIKERVF